MLVFPYAKRVWEREEGWKSERANEPERERERERGRERESFDTVAVQVKDRAPNNELLADEVGQQPPR